MKNTIVITVGVILLAMGTIFFVYKKYSPISQPLSSQYISSGDSISPIREASVPEKQAEPVKEFVVSGANFTFDPAVLTVAKGDRVKITFKNVQGFHDFKIDEFGAFTPKIKENQDAVVEFVASKAGTFEYYCSVGSHRTMGMKGTLTVE